MRPAPELRIALAKAAPRDAVGCVKEVANDSDGRLVDDRLGRDGVFVAKVPRDRGRGMYSSSRVTWAVSSAESPTRIALASAATVMLTAIGCSPSEPRRPGPCPGPRRTCRSSDYQPAPPPQGALAGFPARRRPGPRASDRNSTDKPVMVPFLIIVAASRPRWVSGSIASMRSSFPLSSGTKRTIGA